MPKTKTSIFTAPILKIDHIFWLKSGVSFGHEVEVVKSLVVIKFLKSKPEVDAISLDLSKSVCVHLGVWLRLLFKDAFHLKIHQNNVFLNHFLYQRIKMIRKH
jgi:hypothetical protein